MEHANDARLLAAEPIEHEANFIFVIDSLFGRTRDLHVAAKCQMRCCVTKLGVEVSPNEFAYAHTPRDHGNVRRQTRLGPESPQYGVIACHNLQQYLCTEVLHILRTKWHAARMCCVMYDVMDQPEEPIDEVIPCPRIVLQAPVQ